MTKFEPLGVYEYGPGEDIVIVLEAYPERRESPWCMIPCLIIAENGAVLFTELDPEYRQKIA